MSARHEREIKELREKCPHPEERRIVRKDHSVCGMGCAYPLTDVICQDCGKKKILFEVPPTEKVSLSFDEEPTEERPRMIRYGYIDHLWELKQP